MRLDKKKLSSTPENKLIKVAALQENIDNQIKVIKIINEEELKINDISRVKVVLDTAEL